MWFQLLGVDMLDEYNILIDSIIDGATTYYRWKWFIPLYIQFGITDEIIRYSVVDFKQYPENVLSSFESGFNTIKNTLTTHGLSPSIKHNLPDSTITIDLTLTYDQLRSEIGKNTKEKIKKALKAMDVHHFFYSQDQIQEQYDRFYTLYLQTADSKWFGAITLEMRDHLSHDARSKWYGRLYSINDSNGSIISGAFCLIIEDTLTYLYGANDRIGWNSGISQLLHRKIIQSAQQEGLKIYDFLWASRVGSSSDRLIQVTQFKLGFGGVKHEYIGSRDKPTNPLLYWIYQKLFW